jgi:primary-amine oxidase
MVLDRLKQVAAHVAGKASAPHPFDPLSESEIERAVAIIRKEHSNLAFNAVTLWEPRKVEMMRWVGNPQGTPRPHRIADVVCIGKGSKVYDGLVDLTDDKIIQWELTEGVQPLVSLAMGNCSGEFQVLMETDHDGGPPDC